MLKFKWRINGIIDLKYNKNDKIREIILKLVVIKIYYNFYFIVYLFYFINVQDIYSNKNKKNS